MPRKKLSMRKTTEVLRLHAEGLSQRQIAKRMVCSVDPSGRRDKGVYVRLATELIEAVSRGVPAEGFAGWALISAATAASWSALWPLRSVPLGMYWRSSPLVFSLEPRCHGLAGWQKKIGMPVPAVKRRWLCISVPWSQVKERFNCGGRAAIGRYTQGVVDVVGAMTVGGWSRTR